MEEKMHLLNMPEIKDLSIPEKILFVEDLWESIAADASVVQMPDSHKNELLRRLAVFDNHPGDLISFDELKAKINNRK
jgi:putative addiction module component (TIGR02574 family)